MADARDTLAGRGDGLEGVGEDFAGVGAGSWLGREFFAFGLRNHTFVFPFLEIHRVLAVAFFEEGGGLGVVGAVAAPGGEDVLVGGEFVEVGLGFEADEQLVAETLELGGVFVGEGGGLGGEAVFYGVHGGAGFAFGGAGAGRAGAAGGSRLGIFDF